MGRKHPSNLLWPALVIFQSWMDCAKFQHCWWVFFHFPSHLSHLGAETLLAVLLGNFRVADCKVSPRGSSILFALSLALRRLCGVLLVKRQLWLWLLVDSFEHAHSDCTNEYIQKFPVGWIFDELIFTNFINWDVTLLDALWNVFRQHIIIVFGLTTLG